jgi:importin subunit alpha-2
LAEARKKIGEIICGDKATSHVSKYLTFVFELLVLHNFFQGDFRSQKEAAWAVTNFTSGGSVQQLAALVQNGVLKPFCDLLNSKDWKIVVVVMDGLSNIMQVIMKFVK